MSQVPVPQPSWLTLADTPNAVAWARLHTVDLLRRWQVPPDAIQTVRLVVSELTTNAVRHPGPVQPQTLTSAELASVRTFTLGLQLIGDTVVVRVADCDPRPPVLKEVGTEAENGRGIFLVEMMSSCWGYYHPPAGGKVVWAETRLDGSPQPRSEQAAGAVKAAANRTGRSRPHGPAIPPPPSDPLLMARALVGLRGI